MLSVAESRRPLYARLAWLLPILFCLIVYWHGLFAWYQMDDFIWLYQRSRVHSFADLLQVLFAPTAHGTWRPWSERLPFLLSAYFFNDNALPFRVAVFLTVFADFALLWSIMLRLTRSRLAAVAAPVLWTANSALAFPMAWSSAYMQFLCGFCILLAFHLFLRFLDTSQWRYYWLQWLVFVFGFGVMETMAVYPLLPFGYALLFARKSVRHTLPLFAGSALFVWLHLLIAPTASAGPYAMHLDAGIVDVFRTYWCYALVPPTLLQLHPRLPEWSPNAIAVVLELAQIGYVLVAAWRRRFLPLFFMAVFVILLLPVLPLRDHVTQYYLTLPALALGALWATALSGAWRSSTIWKAVALVLVCLFVGVHWRAARFGVKWWADRSLRIESMVHQVVAAHNRAPGKTIVLTDVDEEIYTGAVRDRAFPALGVPDVYLDQSAAMALPQSYSDAARALTLDQASLTQLTKTGRLIVLSLANPQAKDVTASYAVAGEEWPSRLQLFHPVAERWLGPTWHNIEPTHRWMPKTATVQMRAPKSVSEKLYIRGYCPPEQVKEKPLSLRVLANGNQIGTFTVNHAGPLDLAIPLPASAIGRDPMEITLEVDHTFRQSGDIRDLGLVVVSFEIR